MAIRRCPYCKAIIDESQKYCNNCGTQLLFPEDETAEEDIKGEKIVDDDFKDADDDENLDESPDAPEEKDARREVIDLEEVLEGGAGFPDEIGPGEKSGGDDDDDLAEDRDNIEEERPLPAPKRGRPKKAIPPFAPPPPPVPTRAPTRRPTSNLGPPPATVKPAARPPLPPELPISAPRLAPPEPPEKKSGRDFVQESFSERVAPKPKPAPDLAAGADADEPETPESRDDEADTKEEIARLISVLEKKQKKAGLSSTDEKIIVPPDLSSDLPTWSDLAHDTEAPEPVEDDAPEKTGVGSFAPGDTMDFQDEVMRRADAAAPPKPTIGMPEMPVKPKTAILFDRDEEEEPAAEASPAVPASDVVIRRKTEDFETGVAPDEKETELPPRARLGFFRRIAATIFDFVFIALFWAAAVGLGAMLMGTAAPDLVRAATIPLGLLFGVLFVGYLFLFFFFMGETLGGRLMSRRNAA